MGNVNGQKKGLLELYGNQAIVDAILDAENNANGFVSELDKFLSKKTCHFMMKLTVTTLR